MSTLAREAATQKMNYLKPEALLPFRTGGGSEKRLKSGQEIERQLLTSGKKMPGKKSSSFSVG